MYPWIVTFGSARWLIEILSSISPSFWKARGKEDSQENDYSFLGNYTFPNLYDALVYERIFTSEYLERQIYERWLKSEPSIVELIENKTIYIKWTFHRKIYQESKRTLIKVYFQADMIIRWNLEK